MVKETFKRLAKSNFIQDIRRELLPDEEYLEMKLKEICQQCPRNGGPDTGNTNPQRITECRKRFFGVLLESFVGKPGDTETDYLYAYLESCEKCLQAGREEASQG
jgi:hypothetical protein